MKRVTAALMAKDSRRAPRARHDSVLELYDSSGKFIAGIGRLIDVSRSGACFASNLSLPEGEKFSARLRLLGEAIHDCRARIIWARRKNNAILYGIEFER